jgi:hypothetical protein
MSILESVLLTLALEGFQKRSIFGSKFDAIFRLRWRQTGSVDHERLHFNGENRARFVSLMKPRENVYLRPSADNRLIGNQETGVNEPAATSRAGNLWACPPIDTVVFAFTSAITLSMAAMSRFPIKLGFYFWSAILVH